MPLNSRQKKAGLPFPWKKMELKQSFVLQIQGAAFRANITRRYLRNSGKFETRQQRNMQSTGLGLTFCKLAIEAPRRQDWIGK